MADAVLWIMEMHDVLEGANQPGMDDTVFSLIGYFYDLRFLVGLREGGMGSKEGQS